MSFMGLNCTDLPRSPWTARISSAAPAARASAVGAAAAEAVCVSALGAVAAAAAGVSLSPQRTALFSVSSEARTSLHPPSKAGLILLATS